jgi:acetylornithine deacetylase/succinyl-diaminopimelate desuccinylase-like protein
LLTLQVLRIPSVSGEEAQIPANFGPGDPRYAHADEESINIDALVRWCDVIATFLAEPTTS